MICTAKGPGWACTASAWRAGLCGAHYNQERRKGRLQPIGSHLVPASVSVTFRAPAEVVEALEQEAERHGVPAAVVYREALAEKVGRLKAGRKPAKTADVDKIK